ncbi:MAG TPA: hypothetical protein VLD36_09590 [Burkholderiales bacterium]|nr:hypothetical protein [Burkholderiales bacterium]
MAVGLSVLIAPLHHALLRAGGFPEHFVQLAQRGWKDIAHDYGRATGRDLTVVDLNHLTGISWIDAPVEDVARLGVYALFACLFWGLQPEAAAARADDALLRVHDRRVHGAEHGLRSAWGTPCSCSPRGPAPGEAWLL